MMFPFCRLLLISSSVCLVACSGGDPETATDSPDIPVAGPQVAAEVQPTDTVEMNGSVEITVARTISEDAACLLIMEVANGMDEPVSAGLFAFSVTGNGEQSGANMFPQIAEPGNRAEAQIVLPGADCANALTVEGGDVSCTLAGSGESCESNVDLIDGALTFSGQ